MERIGKEKEAEVRKKLHEMLDIVLDINGMQASSQDRTGEHPTANFDFGGYVGEVCATVYKKGWSKYNKWDMDVRAHVTRERELDDALEELRKLKEDGLGDGYGSKNGNINKN